MQDGTLEVTASSLSALLNELASEKQEVNRELFRLGEPPTSEGHLFSYCRAYERAFVESINAKETAPVLQRIFLGADGLKGALSRLPLERHFTPEQMRARCRQGNGFQPHLIASESGFSEMIVEGVEMARGPARACVEAVHRVLLQAAKQAAQKLGEGVDPETGLPRRRLPYADRAFEISASRALDGWKREALALAEGLVDMERNYLSASFFRRINYERYMRVLEAQREQLEALQLRGRGENGGANGAANPFGSSFDSELHPDAYSGGDPGAGMGAQEKSGGIIGTASKGLKNLIHGSGHASAPPPPMGSGPTGPAAHPPGAAGGPPGHGAASAGPASAPPTPPAHPIDPSSLDDLRKMRDLMRLDPVSFEIEFFSGALEKRAGESSRLQASGVESIKWQKRFFVLAEVSRTLYYFKDASDLDHVRGSVRLGRCIVEDLDANGFPRAAARSQEELSDRSKVSLLLRLRARDGQPLVKDHREIVLRAPNASTKFMWLARLRAAAEDARQGARLVQRSSVLTMGAASSGQSSEIGESAATEGVADMGPLGLAATSTSTAGAVPAALVGNAGPRGVGPSLSARRDPADEAEATAGPFPEASKWFRARTIRTAEGRLPPSLPPPKIVLPPPALHLGADDLEHSAGERRKVLGIPVPDLKLQQLPGALKKRFGGGVNYDVTSVPAFDMEGREVDAAEQAASDALAYTRLVCHSLGTTLPKAIVHLLLKRAERGMLEVVHHHVTGLGRDEVRLLLSEEATVPHRREVARLTMQTLEEAARTLEDAQRHREGLPAGERPPTIAVPLHVARTAAGSDAKLQRIIKGQPPSPLASPPSPEAPVRKARAPVFEFGSRRELEADVEDDSTAYAKPMNLAQPPAAPPTLARISAPLSNAPSSRDSVAPMKEAAAPTTGPGARPAPIARISMPGPSPSPAASRPQGPASTMVMTPANTVADAPAAVPTMLQAGSPIFPPAGAPPSRPVPTLPQAQGAGVPRSNPFAAKLSSQRTINLN